MVRYRLRWHPKFWFGEVKNVLDWCYLLLFAQGSHKHHVRPILHQAEGYSWRHTLGKWRELGFSSTWVMAGLFVVNLLLWWCSRLLISPAESRNYDRRRIHATSDKPLCVTLEIKNQKWNAICINAQFENYKKLLVSRQLHHIHIPRATNQVRIASASS